jgi:hypothetical protein
MEPLPVKKYEIRRAQPLRIGNLTAQLDQKDYLKNDGVRPLTKTQKNPALSITICRNGEVDGCYLL